MALRVEQIEPPNELSIPTCLGCGAMSLPGTCETGCAEHKLVLVRAATLRELTDAEHAIMAAIRALQPPVEELLQSTFDASGDAAYRAWQSRALAALRTAPATRELGKMLEEPTEPAITWWCDRCSGVDAPQPCLGICVWKPVDWVNERIYTDLREQVVRQYAREERLRVLVTRITQTSPNPGQHRRNWLAFKQQAERLSEAREVADQNG